MIRGMKTLALVALVAVGCGAAPERETPDMPDVKAGDNATIKAAWDAWGMRGFDRPAVNYVEGQALNCQTRLGPGFLVMRTDAGTFWGSPGQTGAECVLGLAWPDEYAVSVASGDRTLEAIVHELCHFAKGDPEHTGPCNPDGVEIPAIVARLR